MAIESKFSASAQSDLSVQLLRQMMLIRQLEQRMLSASTASPPKIMGSIHLCAGQEAVPVGAAAALTSTDQMVSTYRGHGWAIASGLSIVEVMGEICHRAIGVNGGRGGSAYMMAPDRRFIGENSIVGAGVSIACGVAMGNQRANKSGVVVVSIGDGAFNQGSTHEGMAFAAARKLPVLIICENNGWSELTPTSETFKIDRIAQRASGYGMMGLTVDGTNPLEVREAVAQAATQAQQGRGPALIECVVPRLWGHYNRDFEHYRSKEDREDARRRDPIALFSQILLSQGILDKERLAVLHKSVEDELDDAERQVWASSEPDPSTALRHVWFEGLPTERSLHAVPSEEKVLTFIGSVNEALREELASRPEVVVYGEDCGQAGGIFGATKGLQAKFGNDRVFDTPISENAILGSAIGGVLTGLKPIVEIMWADFLLVALDQLVNQAANIRYITQGRCGAPIVVRTQQGATPGSCAQHSQSLEALLTHVPGLRVAVPATPQDAYDILRSAVAAFDPCVIFEARSLYQTTGLVKIGGEIEPIGKARIHREGKDAVIVTWGTMLRQAIAAADVLAGEGRKVSVLDVRWLCPLDENAILDAVKGASGRVVIAHEANLTGGFGAEIVARLHERLGRSLELQIVRIGTPDARIPAAPNLMRQLIPTSDQIADALRNIWSKPRLDYRYEPV